MGCYYYYYHCSWQSIYSLADPYFSLLPSRFSLSLPLYHAIHTNPTTRT